MCPLHFISSSILVGGPYLIVYSVNTYVYIHIYSVFSFSFSFLKQSKLIRFQEVCDIGIALMSPIMNQCHVNQISVCSAVSREQTLSEKSGQLQRRVFKCTAAAFSVTSQPICTQT